MIGSAYFALIFGALFAVVAIPMLWAPRRLLSVLKDFSDMPGLSFLTGIILLITGLSVVSVHHIWTADWRIIITILGYALVIKGAIYIIAPDPVLQLGTKFMKRPGILPSFGFLYLALGVFLLSRAFLGQL